MIPTVSTQRKTKTKNQAKPAQRSRGTNSANTEHILRKTKTTTDVQNTDNLKLNYQIQPSKYKPIKNQNHTRFSTLTTPFEEAAVNKEGNDGKRQASQKEAKSTRRDQGRQGKSNIQY